MNIFLNPASTPPAVQLKATGSPLASMRLKRGAVVPLVVTILGVQNATNLRFGIRAAHEGEMLALASADSGTAADNGTSFTLSLEVRSNALDAALHVGDAATSLAKLVCMSEFAWMEGDEQRISDTITTTILNDIVRLASESPEALSGLYPAPELLASKAWVRELRASAASAGLVLLESDAVLEGEHTAVALTAAGTIAIPRASEDEAGTVLLGTDEVLSGLHVIPVGKDAAGKLAVDASGLSAYDIAVQNGFVGTQVDWLNSLKGEPGEPGEKGDPGEPGEPGEPGTDGEDGTDGVTSEEVEALLNDALVLPTTDFATPSGVEDSHYFSADIPARYVLPGELSSIILQGPAQLLDAYDQPAFLSVWQHLSGDEWEAVAVSLNSVLLEANKPHEWLFANAVLNGNRIRFCLLNTDAEGALFKEEYNIRSRVSITSRWEDGHIFQPTTATRLPQLVIKMAIPCDRFAPGTHPGDMEAHLTVPEHEGLTALLGIKDQLLAAFPATATTEEPTDFPAGMEAYITPSSQSEESTDGSDEIPKPQQPEDDLPTPDAMNHQN